MKSQFGDLRPSWDPFVSFGKRPYKNTFSIFYFLEDGTLTISADYRKTTDKTDKRVVA